MIIYIKPIFIGMFFGILTGVIGYLTTSLYLSISQGVTESSELLELLRSNKAMYWSMPFSFLVLLISGYITSRKLSKGHYLAALIVALLVCLSIRIGPLKIISIHMSYIPIIIGSLIGAYLSKKVNKSTQSDTITSAEV